MQGQPGLTEWAALQISLSSYYAHRKVLASLYPMAAVAFSENYWASSRSIDGDAMVHQLFYKLC